jgi:hypothetical protein
VLVDMPKDVSNQMMSWHWPDAVDLPGYKPNTVGHPKQIKDAARLMGDARRPVIYAGGGTWRAGHHPQVLVTTDGLTFTPKARVDNRDNGARRNDYALGGISSFPVDLASTFGGPIPVPTLDALYSFQSLLATRNGAQGDGIWNYGRYSSPAMDALIERMKTQSGPARQAAISEAQRLYREDIPQIPLHHQMIPWAMRSNIQIPHMANNQPYFRWAVVQ